MTVGCADAEADTEGVLRIGGDEAAAMPLVRLPMAAGPEAVRVSRRFPLDQAGGTSVPANTCQASADLARRLSRM